MLGKYYMSLGRHVLFDGVTNKVSWRQVEVHPGIGFLLECAARLGSATVLASYLIKLPYTLVYHE